MPSEVENRFYGQRGIGARAMNPDMRLLSVNQRYAWEEVFEERTGLKEGQYASNAWAFPIIPIPDVQDRYGHVRLAPKNVSNNYLGHPIFWIDPKLSERREGENDQEWSLRMFYLIDAFGMWSEKLTFLDFLKINEFSFHPAEIEAYHHISSDCETDDFPFLTERDLEIPLSEAEENYQWCVRRAAEIQSAENAHLLSVQGHKVLDAQKYLSSDNTDLRSPYKKFDDEGGVWDKHILPVAESIAQAYNSRALAADPTTRDMWEQATKLFNVTVSLVRHFNEASAILELPVLGALPEHPGGGSTIAYLANLMEDANEKNYVRESVFNNVNRALKDAFDRGNAGSGAFDPVIAELSAVYEEAFNRLWLAYINYENIVNDEPIYSSIPDARSALKRIDDARSMGGTYDPMSTDIRSFSDILGHDFSE